MQTANRRRTTWAIAASLLAHAVVLTVAGLQAPTLFIPQEPAGPPEAVIPILLFPRTPPAAPGAQAPSPIRLHQRALRVAPADLPVAPLPVPAAPPIPVAPPPPGPVVVAPSPAEAQQKVDVRAALQGLMGCRDPDAAGLTRDQRDKCRLRLAAGAKDAPFLGSGLSADKQQLLTAAGARKDADYKYTRAPISAAPPNMPSGVSARDLKAALGVPERD